MPVAAVSCFKTEARLHRSVSLNPRIFKTPIYFPQVRLESNYVDDDRQANNLLILYIKSFISVHAFGSNN